MDAAAGGEEANAVEPADVSDDKKPSYEAVVYTEETKALADAILDMIYDHTAALQDQRVQSAIISAALATAAQTVDFPNIKKPGMRADGVTGCLRRITRSWPE